VIIQIGSSTADVITAWATVALGIGTVALAGIGLYQARITRQALGAAERDTREATMARIDQSAPRVTFVAEEGAAHQAAWLFELPPKADFELPDHQQQTLAVSGWFLATNHGRSTALMVVPPGTLVFPKNRPIDSVAGLRDGNPGHRPDVVQVIALPPDESRRLFVEVRKPLAEWVDGCPAFFTLKGLEGGFRWHPAEVIVDDTFAVGIHDTTRLLIGGEPIARFEHRWRSTAVASVLQVERTVRNYQRSSESSAAEA